MSTIFNSHKTGAMASDGSIEDEYTRLILQNREWVKEKTASDPLFFDRLVKGQCTNPRDHATDARGLGCVHLTGRECVR
jgi:hypothetical protein